MVVATRSSSDAVPLTRDNVPAARPAGLVAPRLPVPGCDLPRWAALRVRLVLCVAFLLLLAGCGAPAPTAVPPDALAFRGTTVDGAAFDGASLGGTPVVLWFWAPF